MGDLLHTVSQWVFRLLTSPWFWLLLLTLLVWRLLLAAYRRLKLSALERMDYTRAVSVDGVFVGEELTLTEIVRNPSWFPLLSVHVDFFMPSGVTVDGIQCVEYTKLTSVFHVPPFSTATRTHTVRVDRRNKYCMSNASVVYRKYEFLYTVPSTFYAYPNQYDADVSLSPDLYRAGNAIANRKYLEDPFFLSGIRPYVSGDPLRAVNFKASARSFSGGKPQWMCNRYDSSRHYDSMIFLDLTSYAQAPMDNTEQIEAGLRSACYLFCQAVNNGGRVGFAANCAVGSSQYSHIPCGSGEPHTKTVLEHFAELSPYGQRDYSMSALLGQLTPDLPTGTDLYLITPFVDSKVAALLRMLERAGRNVCVLPLTTGGDQA